MKSLIKRIYALCKLCILRADEDFKLCYFRIYILRAWIQDPPLSLISTVRNITRPYYFLTYQQINSSIRSKEFEWCWHSNLKLFNHVNTFLNSIIMRNWADKSTFRGGMAEKRKYHQTSSINNNRGWLLNSQAQPIRSSKRLFLFPLC